MEQWDAPVIDNTAVALLHAYPSDGHIAAPEISPAVPKTRAPPSLRRHGIDHFLLKSANQLVKNLPWPLQERIHFFFTFGRLPQVHDPISFNEKVLYRKCIHGDYPSYTRLADKYAARAHVASRIGENYLIPLVFDTSDPAALHSLPRWQHTVFKASHGAGMVEIVRNEPDTRQRRDIVDRCMQWLQTDYSRTAREIHYRDIPRRILVEEYIGDGIQAPVDYKFHMFRQPDGRFKYVLQVIYNRFNTRLAMTFFVNNLRDAFHRIRDDGRQPPCSPDLLQHALELSKVLANDFDYTRVDWYIQKGRIYFGELTFTPGAGLVTGLDRGLDHLMGNMWIQRQLPAKCRLAGMRRAAMN